MQRLHLSGVGRLEFRPGKLRKLVNGSTQGSYLEAPEQSSVSTSLPMDPISSALLGQESTSVIISMLQKLSESNQSLIQRVDRIEQRNSNDPATINQPLQISEQPLWGHGPWHLPRSDHNPSNFTHLLKHH